jgi:predicted nucleotidyltransferase
MRLTEKERLTIRRISREMLGPGVDVRVFGSRVHDRQRGGDIDLFVVTDCVIENRAATASRLAAKLQLALGDQKIDIVLVDPSTPEQPVHHTARREGTPV